MLSDCLVKVFPKQGEDFFQNFEAQYCVRTWAPWKTHQQASLALNIEMYCTQYCGLNDSVLSTVYSSIKYPKRTETGHLKKSTDMVQFLSCGPCIIKIMLYTTILKIQKCIPLQECITTVFGIQIVRILNTTHACFINGERVISAARHLWKCKKIQAC